VERIAGTRCSGGTGIPFPYGEPKTEVKIGYATLLSGDKKISEKLKKDCSGMKDHDPALASG
jgi:hypothetical protein